MKKKIFAAILVVLALGGGLTACASQSDTVSQNISVDAEYFKISRQIVFYNGITGAYIAEVNGRCSVDESEDLKNTLAVTCKVGPNTYIKDYLGKADNVTWWALQTVPSRTDPYHYTVRLKPEEIIPNVEVDISVNNSD